MSASVFREFLQNTYAAGPDRVGDFISSSFVFVRIRQRFWRGYRKAKGVDLQIEGLVMSDEKREAMTQPSWKLAPKELTDQFQSFATGVEQAVHKHAISAREAGDEDSSAGAASAVLVGGGRHMVDVKAWPQLEDYLRGVACKWSEAADEWCTEEGHAKLHAHVEAQYGKEIYGMISHLIPGRNTLRARFGLDIRTAPVRIVEEKSTDEAAKAGRRDEIVDLLDLAVRMPREEAAEAWEAVAIRLCTPEGAAVQQTREEGGSVKAVNRTIQEKTVRSVHNRTAALVRGERYLDPNLRRLRDRILKEFPAEAAPAKAVAKILASDDAEAIRVGLLLHEAVKAARSEVGMCEGLTQAMEGCA